MVTELRALMHEVILLLGMFALCAPRNAEALRWRWQGHPTMLHRLCDLPFAYYCEPRLRSVLLPTLLCACLHDSVNLRILSSRLSPTHLLNFVRLNASGAYPTAALSAGSSSTDGSSTASPASPPAYSPPAALIDDPSELPIVTMEYTLRLTHSPSVPSVPSAACPACPACPAPPTPSPH